MLLDSLLHFVLKCDNMTTCLAPSLEYVWSTSIRIFHDDDLLALILSKDIQNEGILKTVWNVFGNDQAKFCLVQINFCIFHTCFIACIMKLVWKLDIMNNCWLFLATCYLLPVPCLLLLIIWYLHLLAF